MTRPERDPRTLRLVAMDLAKRAEARRKQDEQARAGELEFWATEYRQQAKELEKRR